MLMISAKDVMTKNVVSIPLSETTDEACDLMLRYHVSGLPVVDDEGYLAGVITEYDLLRLLYEPDTLHTSVADFMTANVTTVETDDTLCEVTETFLQHGLRRLPVLNAGKLVGIISRRDVVRSIREIRKAFQSQINALHVAAGA